MSTSVTVLGLGAMGLPMATNLAQSFPVTGFDVFEARRDAAATAGITIALDPQDACRDADVVLIAVRNSEQLEDVLYGESGIVTVLAKGSVIILTSTVGVDAVEEVARKLADAGIGLVDAPVSGGPVRAGEGDLLVTCGASADVWEKAQPVLNTMAGTLVLVGDTPGKGQAMKTVNQLLCGVHIAAAGEALALAGRLGLDQRKALEALMAGAAASFMLGNRGPRAIEAYEGHDPEVLSRLDIFTKDMGIVTAAAKKAGISVPLAAAAEQLYLLGAAQGRDGDDDSTIIRVVAPSR
ncbi:NAD(P)-dependent oxidoreductase [Schaalia vaccimaxillae]|uniref:NAD(P)-dependent oxidoreductase n=1 Tax=Schaalia vaccimaxillae TaxID=183916 RepID=UPI0003B2E53C|nr:NAD(P)-dependent oxidoreductase [Schaalia vaccimaxillae]